LKKCYTAKNGAVDKTMTRIAITGANGLVGSALLDQLHSKHIETISIARNASAGYLKTSRHTSVVWAWDQEGSEVPDSLSGVDAVIHLAGESIAGRWTPKKKQAIRDSRVESTKTLVTGLLNLPQPPKTVFCASAIGYYGDRADTVLTELDAPGYSFLSDVAVGWEAATKPLSAAGVRVIHGRFGMVLSSQGGALAAMVPIFKLGIGGIVGHGQQYWSWITQSDLARAILFCLEHTDISGPVNCVSPCAVTNKDFTKALGKTLGRPTIIPLPAYAARLVLGEMADELLLASTRVKPHKLLEKQFRFEHTELEPALRQLLEAPCTFRNSRDNIIK
jgi:uncharacterized protein (TIGR01777 family)